MRLFASKRIWMLAATMVACTACVSMGGLAGSESEQVNAVSQTSGQSGEYGDNNTVQATIGTIKLQGKKDRMSSKAIRLPERPLGEIAVFAYQFPANCGAHEFRVYEAHETQILEYHYAGQDGQIYTIRDYIKGPSPFVRPGLWTAYDHTADSISTMTSQFEKRGDRMFKGVYSRGLVTSLPDVEQRALGNAYQHALDDVYDCRDTQTLADTTTQ